MQPCKSLESADGTKYASEIPQSREVAHIEIHETRVAAGFPENDDMPADLVRALVSALREDGNELVSELEYWYQRQAQSTREPTGTTHLQKKLGERFAYLLATSAGSFGAS